MNRGNIPGFYYDEEKKKYFKIQATHQVPKAAKYSKSSIQQDKRETKKRRLEDRRRQHVRKQTAPRSSVLCIPLAAGVALRREHGSRQPGLLSDRDNAVVSQLDFQRNRVHFLPYHEVTQMENCPGTGEVAVSIRDPTCDRQGRNTYGVHTMQTSFIERERSDKPKPRFLPAMHACFNSPITSISTTTSGESTLLFACARERLFPGNIASIRLTPNPDPLTSSSSPNRYYEHIPSAYSASPPSNIGILGTSATTSLWHSSINPTADTVAVAGTLGVWTLDLACTLKDRLSITRRDYADPEDDETFAVDWLDHSTVAAGSEQVYLWDQRSGGASQRFGCKGRVTGILTPERSDANPGAGGQRLLVSTNRMINLFDVRYVSHSKPILSWSHEHEGPQMSMSSAEGVVPGSGMFAAGDRDGYVHVYSTRTGKRVRRLEAGGEGGGARSHGRGKALLTGLRWFEDGVGRPGLRALQAGEMLEWIWEGGDD